MNREALERLLIDRVAGELSPDVEELLDATLANEPAWASEAEKIGETLHLARLALMPARETVLPEPQFNRSSSQTHASREPFRFQLPRWAYGMAACFTVGLAFRFLLVRGTNSTTSLRPVPETKTVAQAKPDESSFWSIRRFRSALSAAPLSENYQVIWKSPVRKPEIKPVL